MEPSSPSERARTRGPRAALAALACLALGACRVLGADVHNLGELHAPEGRHRYAGALEGSLEYLVRHEIAPLLPRSRLARPKAPEPIEDPAGECLERLIRLGGYDPATPEVAARQVEWFARLAAQDKALLSRERALIELGRAAQRLDVGPEPLAPDAVPAGPEALSEALSSLARAVELVLEGSGSRERRELDLAAAAGVIEGMALDLDGARRALLVAAELLDKGGLYSAATPPLERLGLHLQRVCVRRALATALEDDVPLVRATALEAALRAQGAAVLAAPLARLSDEPPDVAARVLRLVEQHGLPPEAEPGERERQLAAIVRQLYRPQGEVRVRAMSALGCVSGAGIRSLREEVWQAWWESGPGAGGGRGASAPAPGAGAPGDGAP